MKIRPFYPHVHGWLETKLSKKTIEHLWDCIETARGERWNHRLVGHIDSSFKIEDKDDMFWQHVLLPHVNYYGETFNHEHTKIPVDGKFKPFLDTLWVNYQNKHEFNPFHNHGGMYSFAIWMKIPTYHKEQNELSNAKHLTEKKSLNSAFIFQYLNTLGDIITHPYELNPDMEGTMVFFPAKLQHSVNPFYECDEQRISIAGNVSLR
tara:strand:- start:53 stop:673 length:621 start_codon:yes stop_codon:yes gene_type:complete